MLTTVRVSAFLNGTKLDKNNKPAVYLNYISGTPLANESRVLSGTIAQSAGLEVGKTYLIKAEKVAVDEQYGDRYNVTKISELSSDNLLSLFSNAVTTIVAPQVKQIKKVEAAAPVVTPPVTEETPAVVTPEVTTE